MLHQQKDISIKKEALQMIKPHNHLCLIYDTPEEWYDIVIPFFLLGLEQGDKCIYIADASTADQIRVFLNEEGVNVAAVESSGQFVILTITEIQPEDGIFDPDQMISLLKKETAKAMHEGYNAIRITGEMTRFLQVGTDASKLIEYEAKLNYFFPEYPCVSICQYNRKETAPEIIKEVIMTHPILVHGSHIHHNFYYLPPNYFLNQKSSACEVEHWLNNLENKYNIEERYRRIVETANEGIWILDANHQTTFANEKLALMFGSTVEEMNGRSHFDYIDKKQWSDVNNAMERRKLGIWEQYEIEYRRKDNSPFWAIVSATPFFDQNGRFIGSLGMLTDITKRKQAERELQMSNEELISANEELTAINEELIATEEELRQQYEKLQKKEADLAVANQQLQDIIEFLPDATFVIGKDRKIIAWNQAIEEMTGMPKEQMLGKGDYVYSIPFHGRPRPGLVDFAFNTDFDPDSFYDCFERKGITLHGQTYLPDMHGGKGAYIWGIASPLFDKEKRIVGAIETIRDITEQKQLEERLKHISLHDTLTGLHNRAYFEEEMRRIEAGRGNSVGIIVCDVDGLKFVNDTLGHEAGDALLLTAARIIKSSFRESDMVARIGGDEFAAIIPNSEENTVEEACNRIKRTIDSYNETNRELPLSISVGFAARRDLSVSINELFKEVDNKMYREKLHQAQSTRSAVVQTLMKMLQVRDFMTEEHADRLQILIVDLASAIDLPERSVTDLRLLAQFHDIGKVGVPDSILFKPGPLNAEETAEMRQHCIIGHRIAILAPDLVPIADWVLKHHEWWNGEGYPLGLKGEEIPLECRILAIVDAYDAMISDRPYRKAMTQREAINELRNCSGTQFDPQLVEKFIHLLDKRRLYDLSVPLLS
ncbi:MAG: Cyclic di-GMP phosphodiesterase response regulator RpfG [Pelotomaculum sp. PtaB.Bin013]|uniref:MEDS domain-containing protein n=1 Tax=Pelotomaculum isophthalicicum JI TaxID=947010 RepID=A0A9X4GZM5_9FIRM|nr:MEDS domain-containing protein [Pelotomaculum isophthalicicum]MDF9408945.1 MEDS domain-containing protein [Pelotomaculum isophthalicicum JI]OPX87991.1 MAG: Cyclic di-GMP phosphodiesterase response regulator RpfG [Pelotomaculum sp. PtaB.Bin013]